MHETGRYRSPSHNAESAPNEEDVSYWHILNGSWSSSDSSTFVANAKV